MTFRKRHNYYKKLQSNYVIDKVHGYNILRDKRDESIALTLSLIAEATFAVPQCVLARCNKIEKMMGRLIPLEYAPNYYSTRRIRLLKKEFIIPVLYNWNDAADEFLYWLGWSINDIEPIKESKTELIRTNYEMAETIGIEHYLHIFTGQVMFSLPNIAKLANMTASAANFKYRKLTEKGLIEAFPDKIPTDRGIRLMHTLSIQEAKTFARDIKDEQAQKDLINKLDMIRVSR